MGIREAEKGRIEKTSVGEILRYFGVLVLCNRFEFGKRRDLWGTQRTSKYVPSAQLGATGMSRNRFDELTTYVRFSHQPPKQGELTSVHYRWLLVQDFVNAINKHRKSFVIPSEDICVDEFISRWYGLGGYWIEKGSPHYVAMDRKLENGCEMQDAACGRSGIMLRLELVTTAEDEARRNSKGNDQIKHGTAVACRLVAPWAGSHRVVCAGSYFASVFTAEALLDRNMKFIGVVKTESAHGAVVMMAIMWVDREWRYFVSTTSTSLDGTPYVRERWRQTDQGPLKQTITVGQPQVCEVYYEACAQVDRHNRCRQDDLDLEKKVGMRDWSFRVNMTLLGICAVDSWLLFTGAEGYRTHMSQRAFYEVLATELLDNSYDTSSLRGRRDAGEQASSSSTRLGVYLERTDQKRRKADSTATPYALRKRCRICKKNKTIHFCSQCNEVNDESVWFCNSSTGRNCFPEHVRDYH